MLGAFVAAAQSGDLASLEALLAADVQTVSDGGGVVSAARRVVGGRDKVAPLILGLVSKYGAGLTWASVEANGEAAVLGVRRRRARACCSRVDVAPDGLRSLLVVLNPHKLAASRMSRRLSHPEALPSRSW